MRSLLFFTSFICVLTLSSCGTSSDNPDKSFDNNYQGSAGIPDIVPPTDTTPVQTVPTNSSSMKQDYQTTLPATGEEIAVIKTSLGTMKFKLFPTEAPKTVENFKGLISKAYYNGLIFHRVIPDFMIQGGDPTGTGRGGESIWGKPFEDEFSSKLSNIKGALSMANAGPGTNGSQFFIVEAQATPWLDGHHTVFGQIIEGMDVLDKIAKTKTDAQDRPLQEIKMESVTLEKF